MKRLKDGYNINSYFDHGLSSLASRPPLLIIELYLVESLKEFFSILELSNNTYPAIFNFKKFKFKIYIRVNKKDLSAYIIFMIDSWWSGYDLSSSDYIQDQKSFSLQGFFNKKF
jgi:hypothetical protein